MKRLTDADQERPQAGKATKPLIKSMKKVGPLSTVVFFNSELEEPRFFLAFLTCFLCTDPQPKQQRRLGQGLSRPDP